MKHLIKVIADLVKENPVLFIGISILFIIYGFHILEKLVDKI